jgi:hypothetical protein
VGSGALLVQFIKHRPPSLSLSLMLRCEFEVCADRLRFYELSSGGNALQYRYLETVPVSCEKKINIKKLKKESKESSKSSSTKRRYMIKTKFLM